MTEKHSILTLAFAGTCFFMFGMSLVSENLQKIAANRIRDVLAKLSSNTLLGIGAGIVVTVLIQSSGAVTSMLVGLGTAGVITLPQVMGIILGTGIGTTITVQLISFNIAQMGLLVFSISFAIYFLTHRPSLRRWMGVGMGFGLMFWGLEMIGIGAHALKDFDWFVSSLNYLKDNPFMLMCVAALFTALVQSSAAIVGIAMSLAAANLMTVQDAFYCVYGANIGTTATALMASTGGNYVGRQIAWAHTIHKVVMVSLFYFLTPYIAELINTSTPQRDVAMTHLIFNVAGAIVFFPFVGKLTELVQKVIKPRQDEKDFSVKYLDRLNFESPAICVAHAEREIMRMGDIVVSMIRDSLDLLRHENQEAIQDMRNRDNKVDLLNREISMFITKYMDSSEGAFHSQMVRLFSVANDLEAAADVIDNSILELAGKKHRLKVEFSNEGWHDLEALHKAVSDIAMMSLSCFQLHSHDLATTIIAKKREIRKTEKTMREAHIDRLVQGRRESINTSSIHMDVLSDYRRIVGLFSNHVYALAKDVE